MDRYQSGRTSTANNARAFEGDDGSLARKTRYKTVPPQTYYRTVPPQTYYRTVPPQTVLRCCTDDG